MQYIYGCKYIYSVTECFPLIRARVTKPHRHTHKREIVKKRNNKKIVILCTFYVISLDFENQEVRGRGAGGREDTKIAR